MHISKYISAAFLLLTFTFSCTPKQSLTQEEFDLETWKEDKNGCSGKRLALKEEFKNIKDKLIGMNERDIMKLFGKADNLELYRRSQKLYYYYMEPGPECEKPFEGQPLTAQIRFNSINQVSGVFVSVKPKADYIKADD